MELKLLYSLHEELFQALLIVPYGIETEIVLSGHITLVILLIVPYGIETSLQRKAVNPSDGF